MRSHYLCVPPLSTHDNGGSTRYGCVSGSYNTTPSGLPTTQGAAAVVVPATCSVKAVLAWNSLNALTSTNTLIITVLKGDLSGGPSWSDTSAELTIDSGDSAGTLLSAVEGTDWTAGTADFAQGDLMVIRFVKTGSDFERTGVTIVLECADGQILFGRVTLGGNLSTTGPHLIHNARDTTSAAYYGWRPATTGTLKNFTAAIIGSGTQDWSWDISRSAAWGVTFSDAPTMDNPAITGGGPAWDGSTTELTIGSSDIGKAYYTYLIRDGGFESVVSSHSCVFAPTTDGDASYSNAVSTTLENDVRYCRPFTGGQYENATANTYIKGPMLEGFVFKYGIMDFNVGPDSGLTHEMNSQVNGTTRLACAVANPATQGDQTGTYETTTGDTWFALQLDLTGQTTETNRIMYAYVINDASAAAAADIKTINGLALASVKTVNGLAIASVKTRLGLTTA